MHTPTFTEAERFRRAVLLHTARAASLRPAQRAIEDRLFALQCETAGFSWQPFQVQPIAMDNTPRDET